MSYIICNLEMGYLVIFRAKHRTVDSPLRLSMMLTQLMEKYLYQQDSMSPRSTIMTHYITGPVVVKHRQFS